jgi:transcriptional regulator with XRE-family HTH domain
MSTIVSSLQQREEAMSSISLENLGRLVHARRGTRGIRDTAKEIGISPSTLSRIENGHLPDLEKFRLVCRWLGVDATAMLGVEPGTKKSRAKPSVTVHFRKKDAIPLETAQALAKMILAAQRAMLAAEERQ